MKEGRNNTVLLTIIGIATLLIAVVGATFAYFTAILSGNETNTTMTINSGTIGTEFIGGSAILVQNIYPRDEVWATKKFSIQGSAQGTATVPYTLSLVVDSNTFRTGSLKFTFVVVTDETTANGSTATEITTKTDIPNGPAIVPLGNGSFQGPIADTEEVFHVYRVHIYFPNDPDESQNADQGRTFNGHISIVSQ